MKTIKKILSIALCLALVMSYVPMMSITVGAAAADLTITIDTGASVTLKDTDGDDYYEIGTADELYAFAAAVNGGNTAINGKLMEDITVNSGVLNSDGTLNGDGSTFRAWTPIGTVTNNYTGTFDGNNKTVSGLYFNDSDTDYVGLFGYVGNGGTVKNVGVIDSYLHGYLFVGGVVGRSYGTVTNCYNTGSVSGSGNHVGGVVGSNSSTVEACYNTGSVSGNSRVGGVAGINHGTVTNCYNTGSVSSGYGYVGGVAGENAAYGTVRSCYSTGSVSSGYSPVGGVVGVNYDYYSPVTNCYYLSGTAAGGIEGSDVTGSAEAKTAAQFASGEVAYLLQAGQTAGEDGVIPEVWGQNIKTSDTDTEYDAYPTLGGAKVYYGYNSCAETATAIYTNDSTVSAEKPAHTGGTATCQKQAVCVLCGTSYGDLNPANHEYENGVCPCGAIAPIEKNANGVYEIYVPGQLVEFAQIVNGTHATIPQDKAANAILKADIDMTGIEWTPICSTGLYYNTTTYTDKGYEGTFDGGGYTISNLKITGTDGVKASYGLFGTLSGTVKNLGMRGMTFSYADTYDTNTTDARAGAIAGQMLDGSLISDCFVVDSSLTPNNYIVGGIAGCNYAGTIQNCYTKNVTISAHSRCGNLVSDTRGDISTTDRPGTVKNCYTDASRVVGTNTSGSEYITGCVANIPDSIFASGRITYHLNGGSSDGLWKLNATGLPDFTGDTVYHNTCGGDIFYSTTDGDFDSHIFDNETLLCTNCGSYEPATLVTAKNCSDLGLDESYVGYYAIKNASNLYWYSERERIGDIGGSIVLLNDITLDNSVAEWIPIGWDGDCTFDGRGNTITLKLNYGTEQDSASYGLFGTCNYCVVKNLFLDGYLTVNTTGNVGAVAASMYRTTISGVISTANVTNTCTTGGNVGGLVGYFGGKHDTNNNQYSEIENCAVYADVTGYVAGGLIGQSWNGTQYYDITNAAYVGNVTTTDTVNGMAGAIVGYQATDSNTCTFTNIYWCEDDSLGFYGKRDTENQVYTNTSAKTAEQFASGEVAYALGTAFGQNIDNGKKVEKYPVLNGAEVYTFTNCKNGTGYSNTKDLADGTHTYENGFCINTDGSGTVCDNYQSAELVNGVYQIGNAGQLYWFAAQVNGGNTSINAVLTADIVVNSDVLKSNGSLNGDGSNFRAWTPIGVFYQLPYSGTFDGANHTVSGLYFNNSSIDYVGLFAYISSNSTVKNVGIEHSYFYGRSYVGALSGSSYGTVTNCYNTGTVKGKSTNVGGVVGSNHGYVTKCYNTGKVEGSNTYVGGIVGSNDKNITNCYNTGSVNSGNYVGGLVGYNSGTVSNCYNTGNVSSATTGYYAEVGGSVGFNSRDTVNNCYYLTTCGADGIGTAKTAKQFASGEVAYLLQSANSAQVWGQTSNVAGSSPILTDNTLYKVASIDGGGYSVASMGDLNGDGVVDANDYQLQVNTALSDENEASDAENIVTFIRADLNGDTVIDVLDVSVLEKMLSGRTTVSIYAPGDFDGNGAVSATDLSAVKSAITEDKAITKAQQFACDLNGDGVADVLDVYKTALS